MAQQTEHLGLHQWEAGDPFLRTDFNEDFQKIDAAAGTPAYVVGTVNVAGGAATVPLDFTPSAVLVGGNMGMHSNSAGSSSLLFHSQGFAVQGCPSYATSYNNTPGGASVTIVEGGFQLAGMDVAANPYRYIAFR